MATQKLCRDCKFCMPERFDKTLYLFMLVPIVGWGFFIYEMFYREKYQLARCSVDQEVNFITGTIDDSYFISLCSRRRRWGDCGPDGKLFELKGDHVSSMSDKILMDEVRKRGLLNLMKTYKKDSECLNR